MRRNIYDRLSEQRIRNEQRLAEERALQEARDLPAPPPERFQTNELSFVRPPGFKDKTFHVFTLTDIGPSPLSVVIGRTPVAPYQGLEDMAQQLLNDLKKGLSHLEWIEPLCPAQVAGTDARRVEFKWRQQGQPVHQLQLLFIHQDEHQQPLLIQVTGTSNEPSGMTSQERAAFYSVVETIELRHPLAEDELEPSV